MKNLKVLGFVGLASLTLLGIGCKKSEPEATDNPAPKTSSNKSSEPPASTSTGGTSSASSKPTGAPASGGSGMSEGKSGGASSSGK